MSLCVFYHEPSRTVLQLHWPPFSSPYSQALSEPGPAVENAPLPIVPSPSSRPQLKNPSQILQ